MVELCKRYGISRQTGYKWVQRYQAMGCVLGALTDQPRTPLSHPWKTAEAIEELVVAARKKWPRWGPKKLRVVIQKHYPDACLPSNSTIGRILKRRGLSKRRVRRRRSPPGYRHPTPRGLHPNAIWCTDFKGQFSVGDGDVCYPLTLMDECSRYLLRCEAQWETSCKSSIAVFESAFEEFGLPEVIRSDNGSPFASRGPGGLSELSAWWISLGIKHHRIEPGKPEQNGRHERMHRTLKDETASPARSSMRAQQRAFDEFRRSYNEERPHEALEGKCPSEIYVGSQREFGRQSGKLDYAFDEHVVRVESGGFVRWCGHRFSVGRALEHYDVRFELEDGGTWSVYFGDVLLGSYDPRKSAKKLILPRVRWKKRRS